MNKKLCPKCKTGKNLYELDKRSVICPYMFCLKAGECGMFVADTDVKVSDNKNNREEE